MASSHADAVDVVVVGAGAVGCAIAYYLSLEGLRVRLMDREAIGSGASAHATGLLGWLWVGFKQGPSFGMGLESLRMFGDLVSRLQDETAVDLYYQQRPVMGIALDEDEEALIRSMLKWQSAEMEAHWLSGEEARRMEPRLSPLIRGAGLVPEAAQIDSYRLTLALAQAAERHGTTIQLRQATGIQHEQGRVSGVTYNGGSVACQSVVLAMGASGKACQEWLNFPVCARPVRSERLNLEFDGPPLPAFLVSPKRGHIISRADGFWSVGSTGGRDYGDADENFMDEEVAPPPSEQAMVFMVSRAMEVLPDLENARVAEQLTGWYPATADREPLIGPVPGWEGLCLALGHTFKGIHLAPITGRVVRDFIVHGKPQVSFDLSHVLPDRFAALWEPEFESGISYYLDT